ncbi:Bet v1-like protein [Scenedesmus sp. NREL 46B-D3]|nr:Bet v1-like protein [Scenedesmus sp. NREL 46B-D3]
MPDVSILGLCREFWKHFTHPGTFRGLARATVQWACGNGWTFTWPAHACFETASKFQQAADELPSSDRTDNWQASPVCWRKDLAFFKYHAVEDGACEGASSWEQMMDKDVPGFVRYTSWRRTLPNGKTEYKSVTISPNATAREFSDLYLDDDFRRNWDGMVYHHEVLEHGDYSSRQQVFKEDDGSIYGISKAVPEHPHAFQGNHVTMDVFHSMWRSRTVADPWGSDSPACETILLHHEQFKIGEGLARFAVKHGIKKLASTVPLYVEARRKRVDPNQEDPEAYGAGGIPNPPNAIKHSDSAWSLQSLGVDSSNSSSYDGSECSDDSAQQAGGHVAQRRRRGRAVLVAGLAVGALALSGACGGVSSSSLKAGRRHQSRLSRAATQQQQHKGQPVVSHRLEEVPELLEE